MSRIRSVHPGLWTDVQFVSVTPLARLLFIGIWNECDDQGVFVWSSLQLKMRLFPADSIDVAPLLAELEAANCIKSFLVEGKSYGAVRNFCRFQRPKKPNSVHPNPAEIKLYTGKGVELRRIEQVQRAAPPQNDDDLSDDDFDTGGELVGNRFGTGGENSPQREEGGGKMEEEGEESECLIGARERETDIFEVERDADPALLAVAKTAGFIVTPDNLERSTDIVRSWLEDGLDLQAHILPAIRAALPSLKGPSSSLMRFSRIVKHTHAQTIAAAPTTTSAKPAKYDFDGEPSDMVAVRKDIAAALGERRYVLFQSAFRLEPVPEHNALQITKTGAVQVFDGDREGPIRKAAAKHGYADVWAG